METYTIRSSYKFYKKNAENPVDLKTYLQIVLGLFKLIVKKLFEAKDVKLPAELGTMGIRGKKIKPRLDKDGNIVGMAPDWGATKKLWARSEKAKLERQVLYHFNEHSGGFRYRLIWKRAQMKFKNKTVYQFKLTRTNKRNINKLVKSGQEYSEGIL